MSRAESKSNSSSELYESLKAWILGHANVTTSPHRFGGTEFQVNGLEFMHSHGYAHLDIRLSKEDQQRVLKERKASEHRYAPNAGLVTLKVHSEADTTKAKDIIELAYKNARETMSIIEGGRKRGEKES